MFIAVFHREYSLTLTNFFDSKKWLCGWRLNSVSPQQSDIIQISLIIGIKLLLLDSNQIT
jgi:hypothetical protein